MVHLWQLSCRDIASYVLKVADTYTTPGFKSLFDMSPIEFRQNVRRQKTTVPGLLRSVASARFYV